MYLYNSLPTPPPQHTHTHTHKQTHITPWWCNSRYFSRIVINYQHKCENDCKQELLYFTKTTQVWMWTINELTYNIAFKSNAYWVISPLMVYVENSDTFYNIVLKKKNYCDWIIIQIRHYTARIHSY